MDSLIRHKVPVLAGIFLFTIGLMIFGAGIYLFECYSPLTVGYVPSESLTPFAMGIVAMVLGLGCTLYGMVIMIARIVVQSIGGYPEEGKKTLAAVRTKQAVATDKIAVSSRVE